MQICRRDNGQEAKVSNQVVNIRHFLTVILRKRARRGRYGALLGDFGPIDKQRLLMSAKSCNLSLKIFAVAL